VAQNSTKEVRTNVRRGFRVVVPVVAGIGNAIMAVPMVRQLKKAKPDAIISVLALTKPMAEPFRRLKEIDDYVVCGTGLGGYLNLVRESRRRKPDLYLVPFPSNRWQYNALQFTSKASQRLMHRYDIGRFRALNILPATRVPAEQHLHDVVQNLRLLETLGIKIDVNDKPIFPLELDEMRAGDRLRKEAGLKDREPYIVLHAGSAQTILARAKRWPAERYAGLLKAIHRTMKVPVVLVEGPDEQGVAQQITTWIDQPKAVDVRVLRLTGPLGEAAALMSGALAYIGTDSGLAHLAAAVGIPCVTLFAPADPDRVSPCANRSLVVQAPKMCSPCIQYPWNSCKPKILCAEPYCIESIMVEHVMHKLQMALNPQHR
jgi:heptosyltransferase II